MSELIFKSLKFKNFQSYSNSFTQIDLLKYTDTLITGTNGVGKSTILSLLTFALYGKPYTKIKISELINTVNNKNLIVEIEFSVNSKEYKVIRGLKPNKFEIYEDGEMLDQLSTVRDYQTKLEHTILGMSEKTFRQTVILGSADYIPFLQMGLGDRRIIIEELLDLQVFSSMNKIAKARLTEKNKQLNEIEHKIALNNNNIHHLSNAICDASTNNDKLIADINNDMIECVDDMDEIKKQIETKKDDSVVRKAITSYTKSINDHTYDAKTINSKIKEQKTTISFYENHDNCPTCKQSILPETKNDNINNLEGMIKKETSNIGKLKDLAISDNSKLTKFKSELVLITDHNTRITHDEDKISDLEHVFLNYESQIRKLSIVDNSNKQDELYAEKILLNKNQEIFDVLNEEVESLNHVLLLLKDDGVKADIVDKYIPIFNTLISKYMKIMDFNEIFTIDTNFNAVLKTGRKERSYNSHSEGEKKRIDLALLFAMRELSSIKNASRTNLLVLDEVLDGSLDDDGLDSFIRIKNDLTDSGQILFVISHKQELRDRFKGWIEITKNKFSELTQH